jgi:hypothetical protein
VARQNRPVAATLLGLATTLPSGPAPAGAISLAPLQGYAIPLGEQTAAVYYREQDGQKELVTTVASADFVEPSARRVTILEPGASATFPVFGAGPIVLTATDHGSRVTIEVGVDFGPGRDLAYAQEE